MYIDNESHLYVLDLLLVVITVSVGSDRFPIPPFVPFHYSSVGFFFFFEIGIVDVDVGGVTTAVAAPLPNLIRRRPIRVVPPPLPTSLSTK